MCALEKGPEEYKSRLHAPQAASAQCLPHPQHVVVLNIRPTPRRTDELSLAFMAAYSKTNVTPYFDLTNG